MVIIATFLQHVKSYVTVNDCEGRGSSSDCRTTVIVLLADSVVISAQTLPDKVSVVNVYVAVCFG